MAQTEHKSVEAAPRCKVHLYKRPYALEACYHPRKCKKGICCSGDRFDYVSFGSVKHRRGEHTLNQYP